MREKAEVKKEQKGQERKALEKEENRRKSESKMRRMQQKKLRRLLSSGKQYCLFKCQKCYVCIYLARASCGHVNNYC